MASQTQALVIGNSAYPSGLTLTSPRHDATAMQSVLKELGIEVSCVVDRPYIETLVLIDQFIEKVTKTSVTTSLLYYSGHGLQIDGINYIVPIDFRDSINTGITRLISVQSIVDRMTSETAVRIILLDACRTGSKTNMILGSKGLEIDKSFKFNGLAIADRGLAEIKAANDTFIAFAAGPGEVAKEGIGGSGLSPFTQGLVKNLSSVDLPISNLTSRVRQEVLDLTGQTQRTWDQSSLRAPFYFNPGSLLLFVGNIMALVGLVISAIIYSLVLSSPGLSLGWIVASATLPIISFTILMTGTQSVYTRLRGIKYYTRTPSLGRNTIDALKKGAIGGFLGSLVCSLFISIPYYWEWSRDVDPPETFGQLYLEITYGTAFAACGLGAFSLVGGFISVSVKATLLSNISQSYRTLIGCALGGVLAGLMAAPILTWYFGRLLDRPEMTPWLLLPGSVVGASVVVFSIVNFDLERLNGSRVRASGLASITAVFIGVPCALVVFGPLYLTGIVGMVTQYLEKHYDDPVGLLEGGAYYGMPVGLTLGLVIGVAVLITQAWSGKAVLN